MERVWAPWRVKYIQGKKQKGCVFCAFSKDLTSDKKNFILLRGKHSFSVFNIYPYNNGHFMVCSNRHIKDIDDLRSEELLDIFTVLKKTKKALKESLNPQGFNVGINLGKVSGAGIDKHLHVHVVPRWQGDTNFMPVIGNTKVISQSLKELYRKVSGVFKRDKLSN